jgi:ubiquinone/menaquinone biosynthesis C-methylase UbiE
MLGTAGVSAADAVIDVGGGASPLAGMLLDRGFGDLTVLDISAAGMRHVRDRLDPRAEQVHWLAGWLATFSAGIPSAATGPGMTGRSSIS